MGMVSEETAVFCRNSQSQLTRASRRYYCIQSLWKEYGLLQCFIYFIWFIIAIERFLSFSMALAQLVTDKLCKVLSVDKFRDEWHTSVLLENASLILVIVVGHEQVTVWTLIHFEKINSKLTSICTINESSLQCSMCMPTMNKNFSNKQSW